MNNKWWHQSVVYQIYPRSFKDSTGNGIGDLQGIIEKLDYLAFLGVDVIWLCPVYKSPMEDNGYDISDYQDIDPVFGTLSDMDQLIQEAKKRGIRIVMDLVLNHTSNEHRWFQASQSSVDNPYREYYIWRDKPNDLRSVFGGTTWEWDETTHQYYFHEFAKGQPDLNWENPLVHQEVYRLINWWLDRGVGGFRLDVIDLIGKQIDLRILGNGPRLHPLLQELSRHTFGNKDVLTVGETWGATPEIAELYSDPNRQELSMIFQFEHMTLDWGKYGKWTPKPIDFIQLKNVLSKWQTDLKTGWNSLFWNNHDLPRVVSRFGNDTIYRNESAKMLAILLHFMKGTPYIYQGEEIGMTNVKFADLSDYNDVEIHGSYRDLVLEQKALTQEVFMQGVYAMGRDNARTPMQWNKEPGSGFSKGKPWLPLNPNYLEINVEESLQNKNSIFYMYKTLIDFRKHSELSNLIIYGNYELLLGNDPNLFVYRRYNDTQECLIIANFSSHEVPNPFEIKDQPLILSNYSHTAKMLRPFETKVYQVKP